MNTAATWLFELIAVSLLAILLLGCSSSSSRVTIPDWDPNRLANAIIEELDDDGDSLIGNNELAKAPGLAYGAKFIDKTATAG